MGFFPKIVWKSSKRKEKKSQSTSKDGKSSSSKGPTKKDESTERGLFGSLGGKGAERRRRAELIKEEERKHMEMHYDLRLTLYLQAKFKQETERLAYIRAEEEAHKLMHYRLRMGIYLQALRMEGWSGHQRFLDAREALTAGLNFRPPLTMTETAAQDPMAKRKKKKKNPDEHEIRIGYVPPSLKALIVQAAMELRPVPEEHKKEYKPIMNEAAEIGLRVRLPEKILEAYGTPKPDPKDKDKSIAWTPGGRVGMPVITNKRSKEQRIVVEAAALGKIRRLKPHIVYNYDPTHDEEEESQEEVEIDDILDEHGAKDMRTRHLTNYHVRHLKQEKKDDFWDPDEDVHYKRLEDVSLPTEVLPVYQPKNAKPISRIEFMDAVSRGVAESAWDRRYRLDRPNRELRVTNRCTCKYCKTANPYQTNAYRKRHLLHKGIWKGVPKPQDAEPQSTAPSWAVQGDEEDGKSSVIKPSQLKKQKAGDGPAQEHPPIAGDGSVGGISETASTAAETIGSDSVSAPEVTRIKPSILTGLGNSLRRIA